jgi:hypothetical protein
MLMVYILYPNGIDILDEVFFTCEVWFHLSGSLIGKKLNTERCSSHTVRERPLHSEKVAVWCDVFSTENNLSQFVQKNG